MIQPRFITIQKRRLIGLNVQTSISDNQTSILWQSFMPRRNEITNSVSEELISLQEYPSGYFEHFDPNRSFTKWALKEVSDFDHIPPGMSSFTIPEGEYAIFHYKGMPGDPTVFQYIFSEWLPKSDYKLNHRPHFEVLGNKYKQGDPNSEEEIWIPVSKK